MWWPWMLHVAGGRAVRLAECGRLPRSLRARWTVNWPHRAGRGLRRGRGCRRAGGRGPPAPDACGQRRVRSGAGRAPVPDFTEDLTSRAPPPLPETPRWHQGHGFSPFPSSRGVTAAAARLRSARLRAAAFGDFPALPGATDSSPLGLVATVALGSGQLQVRRPVASPPASSPLVARLRGGRLARGRVAGSAAAPAPARRPDMRAPPRRGRPRPPARGPAPGRFAAGGARCAGARTLASTGLATGTRSLGSPW